MGDGVTDEAAVSPHPPATRFRRGSVLLVLAVSAICYAPTLANRYAGDDEFIVASNPTVTQGDVLGAITSPYWPETFSKGTLYRPLVSGSFAAEWPLWKGHPAGFHAVNLVLHALVAVVLLLLAWELGLPAAGALAAALVFAVHPVHVEAVAPVVGRSELLAALFVLLGCLAFLKLRGPRAWMAAPAVAVCYGLGLGAKEIAVTLPILLVLVAAAAARSNGRSVPLKQAWPVGLGMALVLIGYLAVRVRVTGGILGETVAPELWALTPFQRLMTALSLWIDYARLMVFPLDLSTDYAPAVRFPALGLDRPGLFGGLVLVLTLAGSVALWRRSALAALGVLWFVVAVLPVSNLPFPTGVLLAERTLYLPSVGFALAVGIGAAAWLSGRTRKVALPAVVGVCLLLAGRSAVRTLDWRDSETVMAALERDHPESVQVVRKRARDAMAAGRWDQAARGFELALHLSPHHYTALTEAALFFGVVGRHDRAQALLERAIEVVPDSPHAYRILARHQFDRNRPTEAGQTIRRARLALEDPVALADLEAANTAR